MRNRILPTSGRLNLAKVIFSFLQIFQVRFYLPGNNLIYKLMSTEFVREIESNYGLMMPVATEPFDDATLKKKIKYTVDKLTSIPATRDYTPRTASQVQTSTNIDSSEKLKSELSEGLLTQQVNPTLTSP